MLGAVWVLISLPLLLVLVEAASFYAVNHSGGAMVLSVQNRQYLLHVPPSYDRSKPTPLVISMHGAGGWPAQQMELSGWNQLADREQFIVAYPSGDDGAGLRIWHVERGPGLMRDVSFISALIDTVEATYTIDPTRIYANGLSNGGGMAFVLSCKLSDRIAAVGMVGAAQTLPFQWCTDRRPVPMIAFHGTADPMIPYDGGTTWITSEAFPNIPAWTKAWAGRNQCEASPVDSAVAPDVTRIEYLNCAGNATVVLYRVQGGGHTWPGGKPLPEWFAGPTSRSIDATSQLWAYFRQHRLSGAPTRAGTSALPDHRPVAVVRHPSGSAVP